MHLIKRLLAILTGYAVAAVVGATILVAVVMLSASVGRKVPGATPYMDLILGWLSLVPFAAVFVALFSFLPALAVIIHSERNAQRGARYYARSGAFVGLAAFAIYLVLALVRAGRALDAEIGILAFIGAPAGALCGLVYWMIAGRSAGIARRAA